MKKRHSGWSFFRMVGLITGIGLLLISTSYAQVPIEFFQSTYALAQSADNSAMKEVIRDQFDLEDDGPYIKVKVKTLYGDNAQPDRLIVHLLDKSKYTYETARIDLGPGWVVEDLKRDYVVQPEDMAQAPQTDTYGTCPDESVQMVFFGTDEFPSSIEAANKAAQIANDAGFKAVSLIGKEEKISAYKNWLSCENLKVLGRVGHGSPSGIMLSDGVLDYNYFKGLSSTALNGKLLYFNSCQVHNAPLQPAIIGAGAQKFVGGIDDLYVGSSEEVFKCFMQKTIADNAAMTPTLGLCEQEHYPYPGAHGISGDGSDYIGGSGPSPEGPDPSPGGSTPPPSGTTITSGQVLPNLKGGKGQWTYYKIQIPQGAVSLKVSISGGTGDADLYTRFGARPTGVSFDCAPFLNGNQEACEIQAPKAGTWYIALFGYTAFSGISLTASYQVGAGSKPPLPEDKTITSGRTVSDLKGSEGQWSYYKVEVPEGAWTLMIKISGGSGDADLFTRFGGKPTEVLFDCYSARNGNREECEIYNPPSGTWYIGLYGYASFSGVSLTAIHDGKSGILPGGADVTNWPFPINATGNNIPWIYNIINAPGGTSNPVIQTFP